MRVRPQGHRAVGSKLDWIKNKMKGAGETDTWHQFLAVAGIYLLEVPPEEGTRFSAIEKDLRALGNTRRPLEPMLSWLFREVRDGSTPLLLQDPANIKDWMQRTPKEPGFNLMNLTAEQAVRDATRWHRTRIRQPLVKPTSAPSQVYRTWNRRVMGFKDGYSWRATRVGPTEDGMLLRVPEQAAKAAVRWADIQAVGARLAHCYGGRPAGFSDSYTRQYGEAFILLTLFGPDGVPHVTISMGYRQLGGAARPPKLWYVEQCKGAKNGLVRDEVSPYAPYVVAVLERLLTRDQDWGEAKGARPPEPIDTAPILRAFPERVMVFPDGGSWVRHRAQSGDSAEWNVGLGALAKVIYPSNNVRYGDNHDGYVYFNSHGQPRCSVWVPVKDYYDKRVYLFASASGALAAGSKLAKPIVALLRKVRGRPTWEAWRAGLFLLPEKQLVLGTPAQVLKRVLNDREFASALYESGHDLAGLVGAAEKVTSFNHEYDMRRTPDLFGRNGAGSYNLDLDDDGSITLTVTITNFQNDGEDAQIDHYFVYGLEHQEDTLIQLKALRKWEACKKGKHKRDIDAHDLMFELRDDIWGGPDDPYKDAPKITEQREDDDPSGEDDDEHWYFRANLLTDIDGPTEAEVVEWISERLQEVQDLWDWYTNDERGYNSKFYNAYSDAFEALVQKKYDALPDYAKVKGWKPHKDERCQGQLTLFGSRNRRRR